MFHKSLISNDLRKHRKLAQDLYCLSFVASEFLDWPKTPETDWNRSCHASSKLLLKWPLEKLRNC